MAKPEPGHTRPANQQAVRELVTQEEADAIERTVMAETIEELKRKRRGAVEGFGVGGFLVWVLGSFLIGPYLSTLLGGISVIVAFVASSYYERQIARAKRGEQ